MDDSEKSSRGGVLHPPVHPRQQARSRTTRRELVDAARDIFARDGFEQARIEDIAAAVGKTRGAFYAHFQDKEDVFFAIFEEYLARDRRKIVAALQDRHTADERVEALTSLLAALVKDRRRMLLAIEFKLYAIRRPHQKRLAALHRDMKVRCAEAHIDELLPEIKDQGPARKREIAAQFSALVDGLALNRLFDPQSMRDTQLRVLVRAGTEAAMESDGAGPSDSCRFKH